MGIFAQEEPVTYEDVKGLASRIDDYDRTLSEKFHIVARVDAGIKEPGQMMVSGELWWSPDQSFRFKMRRFEFRPETKLDCEMMFGQLEQWVEEARAEINNRHQ